MQSVATAGSRTIVVKGREVAEIKKGRLSAATRRRIYGLGAPLSLLVLWQVLVMTGILDQRFFPTPIAVIQVIVHDLSTGQLEWDLKSSLIRILLGFVAGAVPGVILGLSMGLFPIVGTIFDPIVAAIYPIPKLALMPLIMVLMGLGESEKVVVVLLAVIFPVIINAAAGVRNLDKTFLDVGKNFGASKIQYYKTIALPGALPIVFTGLKLGIGMAILIIVAAELHGALHGVGYRLWYAYSMFNIPQMYESFVVLSVLGFVFTTLVDELEHWVTPWKR